jgi:plastocyanin
MRIALGGLLLALLATLAHAQPATAISGQVEIWENAGGQQVKLEDRRNAVIFVAGFNEPPAPRRRPALAQRDRLFVPRVLVATQGQEVSFPSEDPMFHNVWSRSPAGPFDLGLYKAPETRALRFGNVGVVSVFCNLHPQMIATILVVPNNKFAITGSDGTYRIQGVPPGEHTVYAWVEGAQPIRQTVRFEAGRPVQLGFRLLLQRIPLDHLNKDGKPYAPGPPVYTPPAE